MICPGSAEYRMANRRGVVHPARLVRPHLDAIDPAAVGSYAADRWVGAAGPLASATAKSVVAAYVKALAVYAKSGSAVGQAKVL